ncbi:MAG: 4-(cytidine 5'-diphospho)-2-C-methyl-D-erythritol kinase [Hyphomicrobiales bacterium]|nr:4-(cytidine 5'-diphospho)-2-C-methyl-D-erythritol kinase [Hyphomicrobiales bacterium]
MLVARARAKLNLSLAVTGRRADGYHKLESLVAFTRFGDHVTLQPGLPLALDVEGATAAASGAVADNLVLKAARHFAALLPGAAAGRFRLVKHIPVAAGLGGGSSDAAAALRLLAGLNDIGADDPRLFEAARRSGADVPVCLAARARFMRGIGDELGPVLALPPLIAVLVNPGVALATAAVFAAMRLRPGEAALAAPAPRVESGMSAEALLAALRHAGNDMEDASQSLAPVLVGVLAVLASAPGCRLARMTGSGATCFGLFTSRRAAQAAVSAIRRGHPDWWVRASVLG